MAKTTALLFLLGLMVSCASYQNDRSISSIEKVERDRGFHERAYVH